MSDLFSVISTIIVLALATIIIMLHNQKQDRKYYTVGKALTIIGFLCLIGFGLYIVIGHFFTSTDEKVADGFKIDSFQVKLDVNEMNSIKVHEEIGINFYEEFHHGIYRFIPEWLEYTGKNNITESKRARLYNIKSLEEVYTIDKVNGKQRIRIGDASRTLPMGLHTYIIEYNYDLGPDKYDGFDEFIFHAFGDYWGTAIKNASIEVNFPKEIDPNTTIHFFADKKRNKDITKNVEYKIIGSKLIATLKDDYRLQSALTIDVELPEGYFINGKNNYGIISLLLCLFAVGVAIASIILWIKYGKDLKKEPETVEFYAPEGLDAAEIGFLNKESSGKRLAIALIIELASKGFITIDEEESTKKTIIKKVNTTDINKAINREITFKKLKDYKAPFFDSHYYSTDLMKKLFPNKDDTVAIVKSDYTKTLEYAKYLIEKGYIAIEHDTINDYKQEALDKINTQLKEKEFEGLPTLSGNERIIYDTLFENEDEVVLSEHRTFYQVYSKLEDNLMNSFKGKLYDEKSDKMMMITSFGFILSILAWGFSYCIIKDLNPTYHFLYLVAFISIFVTAFFNSIMQRKTTYGEKMKSKIKSFENYIEKAEKDKINKMVEEDSQYFYEILPYAYVLGVTKKWISKFENIPEAEHYMGTFNYTDFHSIDSMSHSIYSPSESSSSSCGGGCSSCGGGCSSCGGGGSW